MKPQEFEQNFNWLSNSCVRFGIIGILPRIYDNDWQVNNKCRSTEMTNIK